MSCIVKFNNKEMNLDDFINHLSSLSKNITGSKLQSLYNTVYNEVIYKIPSNNILFVINDRNGLAKQVDNESIIVYEISSKSSPLTLLDKMNAFGNPFSLSKYNKDGKGGERVKKMFLTWIETGNNFGDNLATEELRQAYLNKLKDTFRGSKILSTTDVESTTANVMNYLMLKYGKYKTNDNIETSSRAEAESIRNSNSNYDLFEFKSEEEKRDFYKKTSKDYIMKVLRGLKISEEKVNVKEFTRELRIELGNNENFNKSVFDRINKIGVHDLSKDKINDNMSVILGTPFKTIKAKQNYERSFNEKYNMEYKEYLLNANEQYLSESELEQKRYLEEAESPRNSSKPKTDNYKEWLNYKEESLNRIEKQLKQLHIDRTNPKKDLKRTLDLIHKLTLIKNGLKDEIEQFNNSSVLLFSNLNTELDSLFNELDDINNLNFDTFGDKIKFLYEFITGQTFDNEGNTELKGLRNYDEAEYNIVRNKVEDLVKKYNTKIDEIRDNIIKNDITFHNNVTKNTDITEADIRKMLEARDDINFLEKYFLGIGQQSGKETLLPQILKSILETKKVAKESESENLKEKLLAIVNKFDKNQDFSFIFETNEQGVRTGNIIDVYTPEFRKAWYKFKSIMSNKDKDYISKYAEQMTWLKSNMDIIDFRKLPVIKQLYGHLYPSEFTFSDQEMQAYQAELEKELGSSFDE